MPRLISQLTGVVQRWSSNMFRALFGDFSPPRTPTGSTEFDIFKTMYPDARTASGCCCSQMLTYTRTICHLKEINSYIRFLELKWNPSNNFHKHIGYMNGGSIRALQDHFQWWCQMMHHASLESLGAGIVPVTFGVRHMWMVKKGYRFSAWKSEESTWNP